MRREDGQYVRPAHEAAAEEPATSATILAVGNLEEWIKQGRRVPWGGKVAFVEYCDVTRELIETISPTVVVSPLLARGFDCIDLSQVLHGAAYKGRYRAMTRNIPNPSLIKSEILAMCPGLDFDVLPLEDCPPFRTN
ncbi:MAG: hypothetical protein HRU32_13940 [Rhodobacteraceae bacterium]|nr:hypothetical protein [Paracoccaceae bacterium]